MQKIHSFSDYGALLAMNLIDTMVYNFHHGISTTNKKTSLNIKGNTQTQTHTLIRKRYQLL